MKSHGMRKSREYTSFDHAKQRCNNPNNQDYSEYGGRGILFKFDSFSEFYNHIGPRELGMSLDRIQVDGHYEFGNVRWASKQLQNRNRRKKKF